MKIRKYVSDMIVAVVVLLTGLTACDDMDSTYKHFWADGELVYPAPVDSVKTFPGRNRLGISWVIKGDPNVVLARIYWANKSDSLDIPIDTDGEGKIMENILTGIPEGSHSITIYTYDGKNNKSVPVNIVGRVFGDSYANSLLIRILDNATYDDSLIVVWGNPADAGSIGTEMQYLGLSGSLVTHMVAPDADTTVVKDFDFVQADGRFTYRTVFVPDSMAIDTFYTSPSTVRARGPITDLPKTGWVATASSFDGRSGSSYRPPEHTIDGNISTLWVNSISPQESYPHWLMIDMGAVIQDVAGVSMTFASVRNETPKIVEVSVSQDGVEWANVMTLDVLNKTGTQYFEFPDNMNIRYFKMNCTAASGNTSNIAVAEVGAFKR